MGREMSRNAVLRYSKNIKIRQIVLVSIEKTSRTF